MKTSYLHTTLRVTMPVKTTEYYFSELFVNQCHFCRNIHLYFSKAYYLTTLSDGFFEVDIIVVLCQRFFEIFTDLSPHT